MKREIRAGWTPEDHLRAAADRRDAPSNDPWVNALRRAIMLLAQSGETQLAPVVAQLERELETHLHR